MNDQVKKEVRTISAVVVTKKMQKSAVVRVQRQLKHPMYDKFIRRSSKLLIHDEADKCQEGDTVLITQCRPISKTKSWKLVDIVTKAE